jgi:DNA-binding MarR family transcriptional regulator
MPLVSHPLDESYVIHNSWGMDQPPARALQAIRSWLRLDIAFAQFNRYLQRTYGVTGAQLAMLRLIHEADPVTLATLRTRLAMHPATLGQLVARLEKLRLVRLSPAPNDRRQRRVSVTDEGHHLLAQAPVAGPIRLRTVAGDEGHLRALAQAFEDAVHDFGLEEWAP